MMEDLKISVEKLEPKDGDMIVVRYERPNHVMFEKFYKMMKNLRPDLTIIFAHNNTNLEHINKETMNKLGWTKISRTKD